MRLFLDANVLFSAAHSSSGRAAAIFELGADRGAFALLASPHSIAEAERNIRLKYPNRVDHLSGLVQKLTVTAEATPRMVQWAASHGLPAEDAPILAAAVQARADVLVTGDRTHFGHLYGETLRGVEVLSPAVALSRMLG